MTLSRRQSLAAAVALALPLVAGCATQTRPHYPTQIKAQLDREVAAVRSELAPYFTHHARTLLEKSPLKARFPPTSTTAQGCYDRKTRTRWINASVMIKHEPQGRPLEVALHESMHYLDLGCQAIDREAFMRAYDATPADDKVKTLIEQRLQEHKRDGIRYDPVSERIAYTAEAWMLRGNVVKPELERALTPILDRAQRLVWTKESRTGFITIYRQRDYDRLTSRP